MQPYPAPLATDYEHICLTSDEPEEVVPPVPRGATVAKLVQGGGRIEQCFAIIERGYLSVRSTSRASETREYWVNLAFLDPTPARPAGFLLWSLAARLACGRLVFCTRHGRVPVLRLMRREPDRGQVKSFLAALEEAVHRAAAARPGSHGRLLRDEMKEHRRLLEAGVLQPHDFEAAKARILHAHG